MGMTTFASDNLIDFVFRNQNNLNNYDTIRIYLKKTNGAYYENGTGAIDYIAVNRDSGAWDVNGSGYATNKTSLDFPPNQTGGTSSINQFELTLFGINQTPYTLFTGNIVNSSGSNTTINIENGDTPRMDVGSIEVNIDASGYFTVAFRTIISKYLFRKDTANFANDFCFKLYNGGSLLNNQEQGVARDSSNFDTVNNGSYCSVENANDIIFPLYSGSTSNVNQIRFYYGTFPNNFSTYIYAGLMTLQNALTLTQYKTMKIPANTLDGMFK